MMLRRSLVFVCAFLGASFFPMSRAGAWTLAQEVASLAAPLVDASGASPDRAVGLVIVIVTPEGNRAFGFGALQAGGATAPDGDTCFQVGSISKPMTGLLLASMVEGSGGSIQAGDPVNAHLASDLRVPDHQGQPVRLAQLATHYGSLPNMPSNLTGPPTSPAQNYSRAQLAAYLSGLTLTNAPGTAYLYSNLGFGLLGIALVDRAGAGSYSALLQSQITIPLGMASTGLNETSFTNQLGARLAQGYRVSGGNLVATALSDMGVLEGGGEVISTGNDMGTLLRAFTGLEPFPVAGAVERAVAATAPGAPGTATGYGLDILTLTNGVTQYEKAGLVAGYTAYIAFRRTPASGVVVLSNRGQHQAVVSLARQVLTLLTPPTVNIAVPSPGTAEISFSAAARLSYEVQTSSNLTEWSAVRTLTNSADTTAILNTTLPMPTPGGFLRLRF